MIPIKQLKLFKQRLARYYFAVYSVTLSDCSYLTSLLQVYRQKEKHHTQTGMTYSYSFSGRDSSIVGWMAWSCPFINWELNMARQVTFLWDTDILHGVDTTTGLMLVDRQPGMRLCYDTFFTCSLFSTSSLVHQIARCLSTTLFKRLLQVF